MGPSDESREPLSSRLCDGLILALAGWTILCHLAVLTGVGLFHLVAASGASLAAWLGWRIRKRGRTAHASPSATAAPGLREPLAPRVAFLVGAAALTAGYVWSDALQVLWWLTALYFTAALWVCFRPPSETPAHAEPSKNGELLTWSFALLLSVLPLVLHKRSPDDSLYLNIAVSAADAPREALFQRDTLHGIEDMPFLSAAYQVHSIELLGGALSWLSGRPAIEIFHWVLPALASLFLVLAYARLARLLAPRAWPWLLIASLLALALLTSSPQSFGFFAFLRIHQGKGMFVSVFVPLILACALEFARAPDRARWLRLCAAQIAALGVSSTAIWAAPLLASIGVAAGTGLSRQRLRSLFVGVGASWYVLLVGVILAGVVLEETGTNLKGEEGISLVFFRTEPIRDGATLVRAAWQIVIGTGALGALALFAILGSWTLARTAEARRLLLGLPAVTLILFLNPYTAMWVAAKITVAPLFWRTLWLLPLPFLLATLLTGSIGRPRVRWARSATVLSLALFLALGVPTQTFPKRLYWEPGRLKVNEMSYAHARALSESVPRGSRVLAAQDVATWVPTFHDHPFPLVSRENYLLIQKQRLGEVEFARRVALLELVTRGGQPSHLALLDQAISSDDLRGVTFAVRPLTRSLGPRLAQQGFEPVLVDRAFETWVRP